MQRKIPWKVRKDAIKTLYGLRNPPHGPEPSALSVERWPFSYFPSFSKSPARTAVILP